MLIVSLLVGGVSGLLFGSLAATNPHVSDWVSDNVFNSQLVATSQISSGQRSASTQTLSVVEDSATVAVVKKASPAVVSIVITQDLSKIYNQTGTGLPLDDFFNFNFPSQPAPEGKREVGAGTGFIISSEGMILTNKHVVNTDGGEYPVLMNDGKEYQAAVLATDPFNDIALVKIDAKDLPTLELGDSESLQIGQTVIAIGNALGQYSNSVTKGVISGLSRTVEAGDNSGQFEVLENIIQTDAAINSGNSGGPLLNLDGQVIGINTAVNNSGQLIGFALPINQAKKDVVSVQETGRIVRPYLGVRYVLITESIAKKNNLKVDYGALIVRGDQVTDLAVIPGSPADKAGLEENDIILEVNGTKVSQDQSLAKLLQQFNIGENITLKIIHQGEEQTIQAILEEADN